MKRMAIWFVGLLLYHTVAYGECHKPEPPKLPDPDTAVTAQMVKAQKEIKVYMAEAEKFVNCTHSRRDQDKIKEEVNDIAEEFNKSIKIFKARMSK